MLASLADAERHFAELTERLMAPGQSPKAISELSKERARLEPMVALWRELTTVQSELKDNRVLLVDNDDEHEFGGIVCRPRHWCSVRQHCKW